MERAKIILMIATSVLRRLRKLALEQGISIHLAAERALDLGLQLLNGEIEIKVKDDD